MNQDQFERPDWIKKEWEKDIDRVQRQEAERKKEESGAKKIVFDPRSPMFSPHGPGMHNTLSGLDRALSSNKIRSEGNPFLTENTFNTNTTELEAMSFVHNYVIDRIQAQHLINTDLQFFADHVTDRFVFELRTIVASQELGVERIVEEAIDLDWPDGWWQAFKEQYFPNWLKRFFPVKHKTFHRDKIDLSYTVKALYPKIAIPSGMSKVIVQTMDGRLL